MSTITTKDGIEIYYKDWGKGQPIVFSHGWPLSADDWDAQMIFFRAIAFQRTPQRDDLAPQPLELAGLEAGGFEDAARDLHRLLPERPALLGQPYPHLAFIGRIAASPDMAQCLQPLEQRRQRARFEQQPPAEASDRLIITLPQKDHHQILRICQAELIEQGLVDAIESMAGRIDGEAQKIAEPQGIFGFRTRFGGGHSHLLGMRQYISCTILSQALDMDSEIEYLDRTRSNRAAMKIDKAAGERA